MSVDSITASLNDAIVAGNVEAVKTILEAASGLLPKAVVTAAVAFLAKMQYARGYMMDINNTSVKNVIIAPQELKPPPRPNVLPTKYKDA